MASAIERGGRAFGEAREKEGVMSEQSNQAEQDARANEKRRKHKEAKDRILAKKTKTGGLLIVHTGKGKGKTTAAMGMVMRCVGHGIRVGIVQFVKGKWETGERTVLDKFPDLVEIAVMGEGFTWETQDRRRDIEAARAAWERAKEMMADPSLGFVLMDEINIVLRYDTLPIDEVVEVLGNKRPDLHVACTGRNAKPELIEIADLVTEMTEVKHHFRADFKAQRGIEF
jgi:cob(I)alamin adenosyltransferase